jgi:hypothetical protein
LGGLLFLLLHCRLLAPVVGESAYHGHAEPGSCSQGGDAEEPSYALESNVGRFHRLYNRCVIRKYKKSLIRWHEGQQL